METSVNTEQVPERSPGSPKTVGFDENKKFIPSGAIAFFIGLVVLCLVIWFGIYFLMLERI